MLRVCDECNVVHEGKVEEVTACPVCAAKMKAADFERSLAEARKKLDETETETVKIVGGLGEAIKSVIADGDALRSSLEELETEWERCSNGSTEEEKAEAEDVVELADGQAIPDEEAAPVVPEATT